MDTAHYTAIPWAFGNRNLQGLHHSETLVSAFTTMTWTYNSYKKHIYNICNCVRSELKYSSLVNWIRVWRSHNPQSYFAEVIDECPQHTLSRGHFDSPFYPTAYPDNINACLGRILGPPSSTIRLRFYDLDVEYEQDCGYDYVMVSCWLQWRHNGLGDVSNHPRLDCLLIFLLSGADQRKT